MADTKTNGESSDDSTWTNLGLVLECSDSESDLDELIFFDNWESIKQESDQLLDDIKTGNDSSLQVNQTSTKLTELSITESAEKSEPNELGAFGDGEQVGEDLQNQESPGLPIPEVKGEKQAEKETIIITLDDDGCNDKDEKSMEKLQFVQGTKRKASTISELSREIKYCQDILDELLSRKHRSNASPFYGPFDAKSFDFTHYYDLVENPIDLGIIRTKMDNRVYDKPDQFAKDVRLIFTNCYKYFNCDHELFVRARGLQQVFEVLFAKMPEQELPKQDLPKQEVRGHDRQHKTVPICPSNESNSRYTWSSVSDQIKRIRGQVVPEIKTEPSIDPFSAFLDTDSDQNQSSLSMELVKDMTIGEGEEVPPNSKFVKTWRIKNCGNEFWPHGCRLCLVSGSRMSANNGISVPSVGPQQDSDVSVDMISPQTPGIYSGVWRLSTPCGQLFGEAIWVIITVSNGGLLSITQQFSRLSELGAPVKG